MSSTDIPAAGLPGDEGASGLPETLATDDDALDDWDDDSPSGGRARAVLAYVASRLVDEPSAVRIDAAETRSGLKLSLHVAPGDMGKVIGRRGRVAQSIRSVVRAAGARDGVDVVVDIVD
ncbi:MAG TPA: KH domain-containing protein [Acidimicrobiales bacterium]|nr:KH domain-containing protein [Acidimicrobiales bacterium]